MKNPQLIDSISNVIDRRVTAPPLLRGLAGNQIAEKVHS